MLLVHYINKCIFAYQPLTKSMTEKEIITKIQDALTSNELDLAQKCVDETWGNINAEATLHYLQGKIFMKRSLWSQAISSFLHAENLDPQSPAKECRLMLNDIMDFYNKDMYNQ